jgi:hypothetical protein
MKKLLFALLFLNLSLAQTKFTVEGIIKDSKTKQPIEAATVYITLQKDSSVVDYTISDKTGKFSIKTPKYTHAVVLKVSYVGYEDVKIPQDKITKNINLGEIALQESAKTLDNVLIKKDTPPIRIKKDTLEFNASSFKVRPDANVEALLKQLPGVEIDNDGKITVNGKEVNQILVNGKPFFGKDGKIALQNLPSNIINKVQVTDTKSKKEEKTGAAASSNNASINLTIDEKKNKGLFGKIMGGYGSNKRYESSGLINYFKNKTKISALASANNINAVGFSMDEVFDNMGGGRNTSIWVGDDGSFGINGRRFGGNAGITTSNIVGINYSDEWGKTSEFTGSYFHTGAKTNNTNRLQQTNFLPTTNFTTDSFSETSNENDNHAFSANYEIKIDSTASIIVEPKVTLNTSKYKGVSKSKSFENNSLVNDTESDSNTSNDDKSFSNTLTFTKSFQRKNRYFSATLDTENAKNDTDSYAKSQTRFYQQIQPDDIRNQNLFSSRKATNYEFAIEYTEPILDSMSIKLGTSIEKNKSVAYRNAFDFNEGTQLYSIKNNELSNYYESITNEVAPFTAIQIQKSKVNFNLDLGTRIVDFNNNSTYLDIYSALNKKYFVPKVEMYANIRFTKSKNIWMYYNYNYNTPSAYQVLPIEDISNPLNTTIGNPNLDLVKYHNFNFSYRNYDYSTRSGYGMYTGGNYYDSQVTSVSTYDENRKRTTTYTNVSGTKNFWLGTYWNKSFKKEGNKYRFELRLSNNYNFNRGFINGVAYSGETYSITPRASFTYEMGELLTINPSYNYAKNFNFYTNYTLNKATNFTHKLNIQVTSFWPKNWTFGNDFGYNYNSNIADGFKKDFYLWNTSLSYSFFEKRMMAKVKVYDVLNQNQSNTRRISATSITDEENIVLKRYVMFSLSYKLEKFAGKEKKRNTMFMF